MMSCEQKKALQKENEQLTNQYFTLLETSNFAKMLDTLCLASDSYNSSSIRLARYEEQKKQDKKVLEELKEDLLYDKVQFYSAFVDLVNISKEDIRNASKSKK